MKEQNESILERQSRVEEKLEEIEQQFESCTEALEHILLSLNHLNSEIDELKAILLKQNLPKNRAIPLSFKPPANRLGVSFIWELII